jgi:hypothetical protein
MNVQLLIDAVVRQTTVPSPTSTPKPAKETMMPTMDARALSPWMLLLAALFASSACGTAHSPGQGSDSETHFLTSCEDDCPGDLQCICGVCSVTCDPASDCSGSHPGASCVSDREFGVSSVCVVGPTASVCDVTCTEDSDCTDISEAHSCQAGHCRADTPMTGYCMHESKMYAFGDSYLAADGCNDCVCTEDGFVCTQRACGGNSCVYDGVTYLPDDTFPATDGCNQCTCQVGGEVVCTQTPCPLSPCELAFEDGNCDAAFQVFWHNPDTHLCEPQIYGGCGGNENNFQTLDECRDFCEGPRQGTDCIVNGVKYASGATVPDPFSCNSCSCEDGAITICTEIGCSIPCPEGTIAGSGCAECGPVGGCPAVETGCMPVCSTDDDCTEAGRRFCDQDAGHCVGTPACL